MKNERVVSKTQSHPSASSVVGDGGYDRLAAIYPWIEAAMFGRGLVHTRRAACEHFVASMQSPTRALLIGDGRGQCVSALAPHWSMTKFVSIDRSLKMLGYQHRIVAKRMLASVKLEHADALQPVWATEHDGAARRFDVAVLPMIADCFTATELTQLTKNVVNCLLPGGRVAYLDFVEPSRRIDRWRSWTMHRFFHLATDLENRSLVDVDPIFQSHGLRCESTRTHLRGFAQSRIYRLAV